jgi:signal transduction histidine kinase
VGAVIHSLAARFVAIVLAVHVILLPALYLLLDRIVSRSFQEMFVTEIRTYARIVADELETGDVLRSEEATRALLENVLLSGEGLFADLVEGGRTVYVRVVPPAYVGHFIQEDFAFGGGGDYVYFLSTPVVKGDRRLTLRIGFDERPVMAQIDRTRTRIVASLGIYFGLALLLATFLGWRLSRPLVALQQASRQVADGDTERHLTSDSTISELKGLSQDLERMRAELVEVGRRLRSEMEQREREAEERRDLEKELQLRRRLETVGTLAGGIAHEFNNVLVPIQLYTEMALEDLDPDSPTRQDLERVLASARRAKRVVGDILSFTRRPQGQGPSAIDLEEVVREVVETQRHVSPEHVAIGFERPAGECRARGDRDLLHQVLANLVSNAVQAVGEGPGRVDVSIVPARPDQVEALRLPAGNYLALVVSDTGHGMDEATQQRIFEPFFTTRPVGEGSGLGLSVVHGIVESMGGAITVDSAPAKGARFSVFLPCAGPAERGAE